MTDLEKLQQLIDTSASFKDLITSASKNAHRLWDDNAYSILATYTRNNFSSHMNIEEYFNRYLVELAWATLMGNVLGKIHGNSYDDYAAGIKIPGTTKYYIIYHDLEPWSVTVRSDRSSKKLYIEELISVRDLLKSETKKAIIEFRLNDIKLEYDLDADTYFPKLLDSVMFIRLFDKDTYDLIHGETLLVKDFKPDRLTEIIKNCFVYNNRIRTI